MTPRDRPGAASQLAKVAKSVPRRQRPVSVWLRARIANPLAQCSSKRHSLSLIRQPSASILSRRVKFAETIHGKADQLAPAFPAASPRTDAISGIRVRPSRPRGSRIDEARIVSVDEQQLGEAGRQPHALRAAHGPVTAVFRAGCWISARIRHPSPWHRPCLQ